MDQSQLARRCQFLREMHIPGQPLVLPNAWDAGSARAVVAAGFVAVATTSAGVAAALGYDDQEAAPVDEMFAAAARIVRAVGDVPVTVDAEAGYGLLADELVFRLQKLGVAGINLEDTDHGAGSLVPTQRQTRRINEVRTAAERIGYPLVVNARIDVFLFDRERPQLELVEEGVERARAYLDAGADCVYPIFLRDADARRSFVEATPGPVNVLAMPGQGTFRELAADGVARVSYGASLYRQAITRFTEELERITE